jgi:hypothetical protein
LSNTTQDEPDVRFFNYLNDGQFETSDNSLPDPGIPPAISGTSKKTTKTKKPILLSRFGSAAPAKAS